MGSGLLKSLFRCIRGTADGRTSMTGHWHHVDHVLIDSGNVLDERDTTCLCTVSVYHETEQVLKLGLNFQFGQGHHSRLDIKASFA